MSASSESSQVWSNWSPMANTRSPISQADFWELREAMLALRKCREAAGVSLTALAERTGIDQAALSRLESGASENPTINTLQRYAFALGKQLVVQVIDLPAPSDA